MDQEMKDKILEIYKTLKNVEINHYNNAALLVEQYFPEAFEDEKPKPGEVWGIIGDVTFLILNNGEALHLTDLFTKPTNEFYSIKKLASSLEEYYKKKFENESKDKSAWVTNMYGREG